MTFAIGYVHGNKVHHGFVESLFMDVAAHFPGTAIIPQYATANLARFRNRVVSTFLDMHREIPMEGLLFVDTDMLFEADDVHRIMESEKPITSGLYHNLNANGHPYPVFNVGDRAYRVADHDDVKAMEGQVSRVAGVGMGFCWIRHAVLEELGAGTFWPFEEKMVDGIALSEDIGFCRNASQAGFGSFIDPNILLAHYKEVLI